jgi:hypothetical protein
VPRAWLEQAGERVGPGFVGQLREQQVVAVYEREDHDGDDRDGDHHVHPAAGIAARCRQQQQRGGVRDADARDDRDRAAPPEEEGGPEDGPHVQHGAVTGAGGGGQRVGDQRDTDRPEQRERRARQPRPEEDEQHGDRDGAEHGGDGEAGIAREEALDRAVERRPAVHRGGRVSHQPFVHAELVERRAHA